jgi:hypothetical protein
MTYEAYNVCSLLKIKRQYMKKALICIFIGFASVTCAVGSACANDDTLGSLTDVPKFWDTSSGWQFKGFLPKPQILRTPVLPNNSSNWIMWIDVAIVVKYYENSEKGMSVSIYFWEYNGMLEEFGMAIETASEQDKLRYAIKEEDSWFLAKKCIEKGSKGDETNTFRASGATLEDNKPMPLLVVLDTTDGIKSYKIRFQ